MDNNFVNRSLRKNKVWSGSLRNKGVLAEDEFIYTFEAVQSCMMESEVINQLYAEIIKGKPITGTGKENRRLAVASLINALFEAHFYSKKKAGDKVGVLWRTATNEPKRTRYTAKLFGARARGPAKDYLLENGYIEFHKGSKNPNSFISGKISLVVATKKMEELFNKVRDTEYEIKQAEGADSELILLVNKNKQLIEYADTEELGSQRDTLRSMNEVNSKYEWIYHDKETTEHFIHPLSLTLKRHFLEGDFNIYGRIHCGAQSLKTSYRQKLSICERVTGDISDGETVELDFQCMVPLLAYAEAGLSVGIDPFQLDGDAYELLGYKRSTVKKAFNTALNAASYPSACQSLVSEEVCKTYSEAGTLLDRILEKHKIIEEYFFSAAWKTLTIHESEIMMTVLHASMSSGIPVLPIHDGVLCRVQDKERVLQYMQFSFKAKYGFMPIVNQE